MRLSSFTSFLRRTAAFAALLFLGALVPAELTAESSNRPASARTSESTNALKIVSGRVTIDIEVLENRIVRVHGYLAGKSTPRTLVLDPHPVFQMPSKVEHRSDAGKHSLVTPEMSVSVESEAPYSITFSDAAGHPCLISRDPLSEAGTGNVRLYHAEGEILYGMKGLPREDDGAGIVRNGGGNISAGVQGNSGAPFTFTVHYGVLFDSDGGEFETSDDNFSFRNASRPDVEYFVTIGSPLDTMASLSRLVGPPPMPPKWTLGFLNSQWGANQQEVARIIATYREKKLPIDGFIFDFDWKAWGEDHYGEWRWNSTSGPGNVSPNKFPDGASGVFAKRMAEQGVKLAGILKPRILYNAPGSTSKLTEAAAYAEQHHFWYPREVPTEDYFSHRAARNLDFNNPEVRTWFWAHLQPTLQAGVTAWWNDEADYSATTVFNNFQFLNIGRALYEGQRSSSNLRVWSLNRNFYLGSSRYGYAGWSGDIFTGFGSMAYQRRRMLAALDTGEFNWSMDIGGFSGHPLPENYARWMEFAAFVPIMRVHGNHNEKRQPWIYGPTAEEASRDALNLRYSLIPYIYSYQRLATEGGIGLIRPLFWMFPNDETAAVDDTSWMFGEALLVSPVVAHGETSHSVYLPKGDWFHYQTGQEYEGGKRIVLQADSTTWKDIPVFVRRGSIVATQPVQQYVDERPVKEIALDVFPGESPAQLTVYDDDGLTYAYEKGEYLRQTIHAKTKGSTIEIALDCATGAYRGALKTYLVRVHAPAQSVHLQGVELNRVAAPSQLLAAGNGWAAESDRFGAVTLIRLRAGSNTPALLEIQ